MKELLFWLLERMAANPRALFWERELRERFPRGFALAWEHGLLRRGPAAGEGDLYTYFPGRTLTIAEEDTGFVGIDEEALAEAVVPLSHADLQRAYLNLDGFALWMKRRFSLDGTPRPVHQRLYYLGEVSRARTAILLGMMPAAAPSVDQLVGLPALLGASFQRYLVLYPGGTFGSTEERLFRGHGILAVPLTNTFTLDVPSVIDAPARVRPVVLLTAEQEEEAEQHGLHARLSLRFAGGRKRPRDTVLLDGEELSVQATPFRQLLRLVVGLYETEEGWVTVEDLAQRSQDPVNKPQSYEQLVSRIRDPFRSSLQRLEPTRFIEHLHGRASIP